MQNNSAWTESNPLFPLFFQAASKVNTERALYSGLVSLEVPVDKLCEQVLETKTARAKQVKPAKRKAVSIFVHMLYLSNILGPQGRFK